MTRLSLDRSPFAMLAGLILVLTWACVSAPPPAPAIEGKSDVAGATPEAADDSTEAADAPQEPDAKTPVPVVEEQDYSNTLRWTTASEVDNFGFDVYRSDEEEGPFVRLTASPISGAGTTDLTTKYAFEDST
jgi:hypothetical protein